MILRLARWWLILLGGVLIGAGLVLHGQIAFARYARQEVANTFVLWRGIGRLTFAFQDPTRRIALVLDEVPEDVVRECDRGAWVLVVLGSALALAAPLVTSSRRTPRHSGRRAAS
jgi:hypothetical protein